MPTTVRVGAFEEGEQRVAPELHALDHRAAAVEANDVEHVLAEIDAIDGGTLGAFRIMISSSSLLDASG